MLLALFRSRSSAPSVMQCIFGSIAPVGGTSFQLVGHVGAGQSADLEWQAFARTWARVFGMREVVAVDPGTEFQGTFADRRRNDGACISLADARSPRRNGRTERAGK
eukprot:5328561-Pyramimonas_sp.AAC.1